MNELKALIIEDEKDIADLFAESLMAAQYQVETVTDPKTAVDRLNQVIPYLVVLDLNMPEVSGVEILQHIRTTPALADTLVIIASADARRVEELVTDADLTLLKPITYTQLRDLALRLRPQPAA